MLTDMEVVMDFEYLTGRQNEIVVKELSVAAKNLSDSFRFKIPYIMTSHGSKGIGLNWENCHIAYHELYAIVSESVVGFAHLYGYGDAKLKFPF